MNDTIQTTTEGFIDPSKNNKKEISTPIIKQVKIDKSTPEKINYEEYEKTKVECEIIEFEIKHN